MSKHHVPHVPHAPVHRPPTPLPHAHLTPPAPPRPADPALITVRATKLGFLDARRHVGDVFRVQPDQFTDRWMVRVEADTPLGRAPRQALSEEPELLGRSSRPRLKPNAVDLEEEPETPDDGTPTGGANVIA